MTSETTTTEPSGHDHVLTILKNRVPEVNFVFWVIKVLSTTTGETFADYLNETVGLGLPNTTYIMLAALVVVLIAQFLTPRYNAFVYWLVVVIIGVFGTLVTDCLSDELDVELGVSTVVFSILLSVTFGGWYYKERTLSFHTIFTRRREAFYWIAVLFTFALGTAGGDLITEGYDLGYIFGVCLFGGLILLIGLIWKFLKVNGVLCFWLAYILTRPLGASIGDLLGQDPADGGLGVGVTITSIIFLCVIVVLTTYLYIMVYRERQAAESGALEPKSDTGSSDAGKEEGGTAESEVVSAENE